MSVKPCPQCQTGFITESGRCSACLKQYDAKPETVNHPAHYGGDTTYEAIKVIEAWELNFNTGNAVKYLSRAGKKGNAVEDLRKAAWYVNREIERLSK